MKWIGILASALSVALATITIARGQETTKKLVLVYEQDGKALIDSLEKNFYGRDTSKALTLRGSTYVLSPTDPRDHVATPFQPLPAKSDGTPRVARISLSFSEREPPGSNLVISVQDQGFNTLAQLWPRPDSAAALPSSQDVSIPDSTSKIRLVFVSVDSKPVSLPNRLKVECESSGSGPLAGERHSLGWYVVLIGLGVIAIVVIGRLVKRRSA